MKYLLTTALLALAAPALAETPSAFGCTGLETDKELPTIEGRDGVFYRIHADLRLHHSFSDQVVADMAALSRALAERGTTLIYVPIPTKSVVLPDLLPDEARLYGFDLDIASWTHDQVIERLQEAGVLTVDARSAMKDAPGDALPFFRADFHWTARGADLTAAAIADVIRAQPDYADLPKTMFETVETGMDTGFSGMRRILQKHCLNTLPEPQTMTYDTVISNGSVDLGQGDDGAIDIGLGDTGDDGPVDIGLGTTDEAPASEDPGIDIGLGDDEDAGGGGFDLFGEQEAAVPVALLGTSFSDSPINNFPGFLAQHSDLEVINYAITGGNQFGAMISYMTSAEFQENRPRFLVWENPIYNNLAQYGDQPMRELIAAARGACDTPLDATLNDSRTVLTADLDGMDLDASDSLFLDTSGSAGLEARFTFVSADGYRRTKSVARGERLRRTGRFYMPLSALWPDGPVQVEIEMSQVYGAAPTLSVCSNQSEEKS